MANDDVSGGSGPRGIPLRPFDAIQLPASSPDKAIVERLNEEGSGGRIAYVFVAGTAAAVTLDPRGTNLPDLLGDRAWLPQQSFVLGVRDVCPLPLNPEPIIRGIGSDGFYIWRVDDPAHGAGTTT